jgi:putative ATPase
MHYNLISALHKSLRGSDENAALYWGFRMVDAGQDISYIFRRILRFAAEDIGNADPQAVPLVLSCWQSFDRLGAPEGHIFLTQALIYLALAPKSNAAYVAEGQVKNFVKQYGSLMPPKNILNAPTTLMKDLDYGKDYKYDHDLQDGFSGDNYFPEKVGGRPEFYRPVERGFERELGKRIQYFNSKRKNGAR